MNGTGGSPKKFWYTLFFRVVRWILSGLFLILGLLGLFLPFLQGILFLAIGLMLVSPDIPFVRGILVRSRRKFPPLRGPLKKCMDWMARLSPRDAPEE